MNANDNRAAADTARHHERHLWCFMNWIFDHSGEWTAWSQAKEGLQYRIQVCDDGTFDISKSDHGLVIRTETFQMLRNAKAFCETAESVFEAINYDPNEGIADDAEAAT